MNQRLIRWIAWFSASLSMAQALGCSVANPRFDGAGGSTGTSGAGTVTPIGPGTSGSDGTAASTGGSTGLVPEDSGADGTTSVGVFTSGGAASTGGGADVAESGDETTDTDTDGTSIDPCCNGGERPGCGDPGIEDCVCPFDAYCCDTLWDEICTQLAVNCGLECMGLTNNQDCCSTGAGPTCADATITACVCGIDKECCESQWDAACVVIADQLCGAACVPGAGDCCTNNGDATGCDDIGIQACVCDIFADPCCGQAWDDACVEEAQSCGAGCFGGGACCFEAGTPGCFDEGGTPATAACVCDVMPSCCSVAWTAQCVQLATTTCGVACP